MLFARLPAPLEEDEQPLRRRTSGRSGASAIARFSAASTCGRHAGVSSHPCGRKAPRNRRGRMPARSRDRARPPARRTEWPASACSAIADASSGGPSDQLIGGGLSVGRRASRQVRRGAGASAFVIALTIVLDVEDVRHLAVVVLGPDLIAVCDVDELGRHAERVPARRSPPPARRRPARRPRSEDRAPARGT